MGGQVQTFYVIKRDEEPRYWGWGWWTRDINRAYQGDESLMTYQLSSLISNHPTARIVKIELREVDGE